jgi:carbamoylphosphate synthase large subunit
MTTFLITGIGGPAGRSLARQLNERGFRVVGTDMRQVDIAGATVYQVPAATDPTFLDALHTIAQRTHADVLIPTVTEELVVLAEHGSHRFNLQLIMSPFRGTWLANDKYLTYEQLHAVGVQVPQTVLPSQVRSLAEVTERVGMPCLSKPRCSRGGRGVVVHEGDCWEAIRALDDHSILQAFAPGTEYAPNLYMHANGDATVVVLEKTELAQGRVGNAVKVQRVEADDVADVAVAAAQVLGLRGPVDVDVRRMADGTPVVLEINARFGANSAFAPEILAALLRDVTPSHATHFITSDPTELTVWSS